MNKIEYWFRRLTGSITNPYEPSPSDAPSLFPYHSEYNQHKIKQMTVKFNKHVNLIHVNEFLKKEIKEISERWGQFMINKRAIEREKKNLVAFSKSKEARLMNLLKKMKNMKDDEARQKFMSTLGKKTQEDLKAISEREDKKSALEQATNGLKEFEEFLEVATNLQTEIQEDMLDNSEFAERRVPISIGPNEKN